MICDSYLAILLYRSGNASYKHIINGLCGYFKNSSINEKRFFPFLEGQIKENNKEVSFESAACYIKELKIYNHSSTSAGVYITTSSLGSIIGIEQENTKLNERVKCLVYKKEPEYGDAFLQPRG